ncbi:PD-(D/E)XK nuclease superfamily protein [Sphingopyxis sp. YR583]|uniref:PD-(D/E)XK nuclease family protein n=1 Tax=Sphingopyxis sp. YR583 TaxID=1881047 RepID=UPI0008A753FD|nr:PD-(D/E)XK nuclease family protein [Sphingopyxis sp. YR583]SEH12882.1 PD-(D/E)XK nuclease superfamily protein [Sphingopyxis sp. YR583]
MRRDVELSVRGRAALPAVVGEVLEACPFCGGASLIRKGTYRKTFETVQRWQCRTCRRTFLPVRAKGKHYPLKIILESLIVYYSGETRERTSAIIKERFGIAVPGRTLSSWLAEYRELTGYDRVRGAAQGVYSPKQLVRSVRLHHKQVYKYCVHRAKLAWILGQEEYATVRPLGIYLAHMMTDCPHSLFATDARASQGKAPFDIDAVAITATHNHACRLAHLVLQTVTVNKRRHDELQRFMLHVDAATVAVEVPIYLTPEDIRHFREVAGFDVPLDDSNILTGHIDIVQLRGGKIHILDYKPKAAKEKPIVQLMVYALALSRRMNLRLFDFVCAWFDEHDYFEFYPLHVVHKRRGLDAVRGR